MSRTLTPRRALGYDRVQETMAFRRRFRSRGRRRLPLRWTGDQPAAVVAIAAGTLAFTSIVVPTDYEQSATMEQGGATLVRVRASIALVATVVGSVAGVGIFHADEAVNPVFGGNYDPLVFSQLIRGDVLYFRRLLVGAVDPIAWEIDVRVKRKLQDSQVHLVVAVPAASAGDVTGTWSARALIRGG